jgi:hypothetical protein
MAAPQVRSIVRLKLSSRYPEVLRRYQNPSLDEHGYSSFSNLSTIVKGVSVRQHLQENGFSFAEMQPLNQDCAKAIFDVKKDKQATSSQFFAVYKVHF